jgi:farnesol dehydrogenase
MRAFITGGTGFIGSRLVEKLAGTEDEVVLLVRNPVRAKNFTQNNIRSVRGDISEESALREGMNGCDTVFHLAAYARPWSKDPSLPYRTNVTGTKNVIKAALATGIRKIVITSTTGTLCHPGPSGEIDETLSAGTEYHTDYDRTKAEAERLAVEYSRGDADISIVHPSRVYGPGLFSSSNALTTIIDKYISGKWRIMPGDGKAIGNYVFVDDVVEGHILAARRGRRGERYILGGENLSFLELFRIIGEVSGTARKVFPMPAWLMHSVAGLSMALSATFGVPPAITREWIDKYMKDWVISSDKAIRELGYKITPFSTGVSKTITWLKEIKENDKY